LQAQPQLSESAFLALRLGLLLCYFAALAVVIRRAILLAVGRQSRDRSRRRYALAVGTLLTSVCLPLILHQAEECTVSNSAILSSSVVNYSTQADFLGLIPTVRAGSGYDVDRRTIHRLMIEAARRTEHILPEPAPCVWQISLDTTAVTYELRAFTNDAALRHETHSRLQADVLDAFNCAGVEIMAPSVMAHCDASMLAVPQEQLPDRTRQRGIAVEVDAQPKG